MMSRHLLFVLAAGAALTAGLAACSADDTATAGEGQKEIRLTTTIGDDAVTRSFNTANLLNGDTVYVWTDMVTPATSEQAQPTVTEYFKAWALQANGLGGLSTLAASNAKLFPATNVLNFYALVGNFGRKAVTVGDEETLVPKIDAETNDFPSAGILHTVMADQSGATGEAYYKSDLLYAVKMGQEPISTPVPLALQHMLSRIQVVLVAGNGMTTADLSGATVELVNLYRQVTFKPDKEKDFGNLDDLGSMLTIPKLDYEPSTIVMATSVTASAADAAPAGSTLYADAIVVPQEIAAGTPLVKVSYLGRVLYYRAPQEGLTLQNGRQYRFRLIADRTGNAYLAAPEIEDWKAETPIPLDMKY